MKTRRRIFLISLGASVAAYAFRAPAQQSKKPARIGFLHTRPRAEVAQFQAFLAGLQTLGYLEGKNLVIDYLHGELSEFPDLAHELVRRRVDVIFAPTPQAALAARKATQTIPIVFAVVGDPVGAGLAESLRRPGGNATGLTAFGSDLVGKRLELLKELNPRMARVGVIWNPSVPDKVIEWKNGEHSAQALKLQLQSLEVRSNGDFDRALGTARSGRAEALIVFGEPLTFFNRGRIIAFASQARIPAIFNWREAALEGGLIAFGPSIADNYRRAAAYVDKILKGEKPGNLPIEQPTKLELVINNRTAKAVGITIPQTVLVRADEVIE